MEWATTSRSRWGIVFKESRCLRGVETLCLRNSSSLLSGDQRQARYSIDGIDRHAGLLNSPSGPYAGRGTLEAEAQRFVTVLLAGLIQSYAGWRRETVWLTFLNG